MLLLVNHAGVQRIHMVSGGHYARIRFPKNMPSKASHPLIPHGLAVVITAPAVFEFTSVSCPERHIEAAKLLGADTTFANKTDAGKLLADTLRMHSMSIENGLKALKFTQNDIPQLVKSTVPLERLNRLAPLPQSHEDFTNLYQKSLQVY